MQQRFFVFKGSHEWPLNARRDDIVPLQLYEHLEDQFVATKLRVTSIHQNYHTLSIWGDAELDDLHYYVSIEINLHDRYKSTVIFSKGV